ncbi:flavin reductase [Salinibacterium sp. GXW1014]|uniref:flavin reductase n=1 Tax=Salinibacterium sp. GXW1014 TaxID=3377838 RepID=UPI00383A6578
MTQDATAVQPIDPARFRQVLGHYPTGVVVITAIRPDGEPLGMTVGSFSSVSLDPMLVSFMPTTASKSFQALREADCFCVNVLAADQEGLARRFARSGPDRFEAVPWSVAESGAPVLDGTVASIHCTFDSIVEAGDHYIVLGAVQGLEVHRPVSPLLFFQGGYGKFSLLAVEDRSPSEMIESVRLVETFRGSMQDVADAVGAECSALTVIGSDLTVVATAAGTGLTPQGALGSRIPYMPPLGELYAALDTDESALRWLGRAASLEDEDVMDRYRERLDLARERGWSMSFAGEYPDVALFDALRDYSGGDLTPVRLAEIREVIRSANKYYEHRDLVEGERYDVTSIVAPVMCDGLIRFVLRLRQLPTQATPAQISGWIDALTDAAAKASETLSAHGSCR